mgnify:FL=1
MEMYKDRFKDASDFTFYFVGNIDVEKMKPMIAKYLGGLPSINRKETFKDTKMEIRKGQYKNEFAKKQDTRLVIPFTSKDNTVFQNPTVYQINTPQSYLYSEVYDHFVRQFPNANVIFIEASQGTKDKAESSRD